MTMHYYCSRGISGVLEIGFRNPQPKINSNAREFIKEARQSAFEKTRFQFLAKPKGQVQVCRSEGQEHRNPTAESRARTAGQPALGARPRCHRQQKPAVPSRAPSDPPGGDRDVGKTHCPGRPGPLSTLQTGARGMSQNRREARGLDTAGPLLAATWM